MTFLLTYLVIGFLLTFLLNQIIYYTKVEEPFTNSEIFATIALWPLVILYIIYFLLFCDWRD